MSEATGEPQEGDGDTSPIRGRTTPAFGSHPEWLRIGGAILLTFAAFSISVAMQLPQQGYTFLLLYPAVIASAYFAGRDSGLAATATGTLLVGGRMLVMWDSASHMAIVQAASLGLFILIGSGSAVLMSRLKRALRQLEASNARLIEATGNAQLAREETDLLLRELRHRIRNDLTNIVAIIRMQAKSMPPDTAAQLTASADRLQVLAKVHERLSRKGHRPVVDMKPFLQDLCNELRATLLPLKPVALEVEIDEVSLPSTRAVSAGLIVNELVTNAMKYAYPDEREGTICVFLECSDQQIELGVEDDGIGMSEAGAEAGQKGSGLGHRLVRSLAAQLGGRFTCQASTPGTSCMVTFPRLPPSGRPQRAS